MSTKNIAEYIDKYGMLVTKDQDGGDSCAHGFAVLYSGLVRNVSVPVKPISYLNTLEAQPGRYTRHPDHNKWYSDLDRLSRDQFTPLLAFIGYLKQKDFRWRLFKAHLRRGLLFAWNTRKNGQYPTFEEHQQKNSIDAWDYKWKLPDVTGPEIWAMWIRAYRAWYLYPLLCVLDLQTLFSSIHRRYYTTDNIQMNQVILTDFSTRVLPTPISLLARRVYGKRVAREALTNMWGNQDYQPPIDEYLIPLVDSWKVRE